MIKVLICFLNSDTPCHGSTCMPFLFGAGLCDTCQGGNRRRRHARELAGAGTPRKLYYIFLASLFPVGSRHCFTTRHIWDSWGHGILRYGTGGTIQNGWARLFVFLTMGRRSDGTMHILYLPSILSCAFLPARGSEFMAQEADSAKIHVKHYCTGTVEETQQIETTSEIGSTKNFGGRGCLDTDPRQIGS